jgi:hypothetical protein
MSEVGIQSKGGVNKYTTNTLVKGINQEKFMKRITQNLKNTLQAMQCKKAFKLTKSHVFDKHT